jgi:outer membrane receptor for ferrienterochelin and colicin
MRRTVLVISVLLWTLSNVAAQVDSEQNTEGSLVESVKGMVTAAGDTRLPGVEVTAEGTPFSAVTDENGEYVLTGIPAGQYVLRFSIRKFAVQELPVTIEAGKTTILNVVMELENLNVEITVRPDSPELMRTSESIGVVEVMPSQVAALPSLGEKDIFRSIQLMPGVSASTESSAELFVRGGTPDQNLVRFDGFTLYGVDHFFGIFSSFNPNAVDRAILYKGGFESEYGGRLSSVADLIGKSGRNNAMSFGGGVSFLSANGYLDVPLGTKGAFSFAARRSFQTPFSDRIRDAYSDNTSTDSQGGRDFLGFATDPESYFYDINARATYDVGPQDSLIFSFYNGRDYLDNSRDVALAIPVIGVEGTIESFDAVDGRVNSLTEWWNNGLSANWIHDWNQTFFSRLTFAHSLYDKRYDRSTDFKVTEDVENNDLLEEGSEERRLSLAAGSSETNDLRDYTFRFDNFLVLGSEHSLGFGAEAIWNDVNYNFNFRDDIALFDRSSKGSHFAFYLQDTWLPFPRFTVTPGIRGTYYDITKKGYADPRLSVTYRLTDRLRLKAAGGAYHQFINRLTREDPLQGDQNFWMLSDDDLIPVSSATHLIGGISYETEGYLFDAEAYRKNLSGLSEFATLRQQGGGSRDSQDIDLRERFFTGTGRASGLEFLAQKKFGRNIGWITYTFGHVDYFFPEISDSKFPASHDSTHELKLVDSYRWKDFTFSGNWVYASGKPYTEPAGVFEVALPFGERTIQLVELGEKNAVRLPAYHRLDLSASWNFYTGETSRATAGVSVFNVYNRENVWRREYDVIQNEIVATDVNYLGLTISGFLNVDFSMASMAGNRSQADGKAGASRPKAGKKEKIYDFYGTLQSMDSRSLVVDSKWGTESFVMTDSSIKGAPDYDPGTQLHIYYKEQDIGNVVTMVVRKVD